MNELQTLLALPLSTIVVLAAGYLSYRVAYIGKDQKHRSIDIAFISLVFGLVAKVVFEIAEEYETAPTLSTALAISAAIFISCIWRKWGADGAGAILRWLKVSHSDGHTSAWDTVRLGDFRIMDIDIRMNDGMAVTCDRTKDFENQPHGPVLFGEDGSVALYVTHVRKLPGEDWIETKMKSSTFPPQMTIIPANQIKLVSVRQI